MKFDARFLDLVHDIFALTKPHPATDFQPCAGRWVRKRRIRVDAGDVLVSLDEIGPVEGDKDPAVSLLGQRRDYGRVKDFPRIGQIDPLPILSSLRSVP